MQITFNVDLLDLEDNPVKDDKDVVQNIGKLLGAALVNAVSRDHVSIMKYRDWGKKMYNHHMLNLDNADRKILTDFVDQSETLTVLTKAAIFDILDQSKGE